MSETYDAEFDENVAERQPGFTPTGALDRVRPRSTASNPLATPEQVARTYTRPVWALVEEIKSRLAEVADREEAVEQRERSIEQQRRMLEQLARWTVRRRTMAARRKLLAKRAELDAAAADLSKLRRKIELRRLKAEHRELQLERRDFDLTRRADALRDHERSLDELRGKLRRKAEKLKRATSGIRAVDPAAVPPPQAAAPGASRSGQARATAQPPGFTAPPHSVPHGPMHGPQSPHVAPSGLDGTLPSPIPSASNGPAAAWEQIALSAGKPMAVEAPSVTGAPAAAALRRPARFPFVRTSLLSLVTAGAAAAAWIAIDRPAYRHDVLLQIRSVRNDVPRLTAEHAAMVLQPGGIERRLSESRLAEAWRAAREAGLVAVAPNPNRPEVRVTLTQPTDNPNATRELLLAAAEAYARDPYTRPAAVPARLYDIFSADQARVQRHFDECVSALRDVDARLRSLPTQDEWTKQLEALAELRARVQGTDEQARALRQTLAQLRELERPTGVVSDDALAAELAGDPMYQDDIRELRSAARQFQTELSVVLLMLSEPLEGLRGTVKTLRSVLEEQRELQPPASVATILEDCLVRVNELDRAVVGLAHQLGGWREKAEKFPPDGDASELVAIQSALADEARKVVDLARSVLREAQSRVDSLTGGGQGGTREIVVAAVLKGDLSRLEESVAAVAQAAVNCELSSNFKLETQDRQLRGLSTRTRERREALRAEAHRKADREAAEAHERKIAETEDALTKAEQERVAALTAALEALGELPRIAGAMIERASLEAGAQEIRSEKERLDAELALVRARIQAPAPEDAGVPDTVTVAAEPSVQTAGVNVEQKASIAGGAAFVGLWLLAAVLTSGARTSR